MTVKPLRVLLLEDREVDGELLLLELQRAGFAPDWKRVWSSETFEAALAEGGWQVILADYQMPRFTATAALDILKAQGSDVPFIIVSGSVGEAVAVEAMKAGAHDFFPKSNLTRLPAAIEREVAEATIRRERRQAMAQLREVEERYRLMIEHVRDYAIFLLTPERNVLTWNPGATRTLGYEQGEILGRSISTFYGDGGAAGVMEALDRAGAGGVVHEEGWTHRKGGARFWAERSFERVSDGDVLRGYTVIIRDVSERKRLMDDLHAAIRTRDDFLSVAAHELKTPIHSLKLHVELVARAVAGPDPIAPERLSPKLTTINRNLDRLAALGSSLLDVAALHSASLQLQLQPVDVCAAVRATVERLSGELRKIGCEVRLEVQGEAVATVDAARLDQIVMNLLSNAAKYGAGAPIDVSVREEGGFVVLQVRDGGIGIAPEALSRIFHKFERAVSTENYGGLGLGLFICRELLEAMGGVISASSAPGRGSTFTVRFPRASPGAATP